MNIYLESLLVFLGVFLIIFLIDYFLINRRRLNLKNNVGKTKKGKVKKVKNIGEIDYLMAKFHLDETKLDKNKIIIWISLINSFIISFTSTIIVLIPLKLIWQLLIAFVILFALIYALYEIYGRHLKKQENKKIVNSKKPKKKGK